MELSPTLQKQVRSMQKNEVTDCAIYARLAARQKSPENRRIIAEMGEEELEHAAYWQGYTGTPVAPNRLAVFWYCLLNVIFGFTFTMKVIQKREDKAVQNYRELGEQIPEALAFAEDEHNHENNLINLLNEERLEYVGSMVLGLNDALVELTGTIAGMTFALQNTRLVALSGIITGVSATLSMAASNYLAERAAGKQNALKSCMYTGIAYLVTVVLLVLPYLLFPNHLYAYALVTMLLTVILIILFFNYYISVAQSQPFFRRFGEMAGISLTVALISFVIGILVKRFLGIDI